MTKDVEARPDDGVAADEAGKPLSVRGARAAKRAWENQRKRQLIDYALDPAVRRQNLRGCHELVKLMLRPEGIATNQEVSAGLGFPNADRKHLLIGPHSPRSKQLEDGYTMKISAGEQLFGGNVRIYSKPAVALIAMSSRGAKAAAFRAWMAEVVARAATHPDFADLLEAIDGKA